MQNPILKFRKLEYLIFYNKPRIVLKQNRFFVPVSSQLFQLEMTLFGNRISQDKKSVKTHTKLMTL